MHSLRIAHVITGLGAGGAEMMLYKLVAATRAEGHHHGVASLIGEGPVAAKLADEGVRVTSLGMRRGIPDPRALPRLVRWLRSERPDVVQGWMYHANLLAGLAAALAGRIPVVWGIHHADVDRRTVKPLSHWTRAAGAHLSAVLPARIVCCAEAALRSHAAIGYRADRMLVIPNGIDLRRFAPNAEARARVRRELDIDGDAPVVGLIARLHPDKDHANFLAAARLVARARPNVVFVLAGAGLDGSNPAIAAPIDRLALRDRIRLLGIRQDVPEILAAIDVLALSSRTEGFPNVIGEAMSCGVPCAVTDCGDSRDIVGPTGRVAPPGDPAALSAAILELLALPAEARAALGAAARDRVQARYDLRAVARRYLELYADVCGSRDRREAESRPMGP